MSSSQWTWPVTPWHMPAEEAKGASEQAQAPILRTLVELVDHNAQHNPDHLFCIQQVQTPPGPELIRLTYRMLKAAVHLYTENIVRQLCSPPAHGASNGAHIDHPRPIALLLDGDVDVLIHTFAVQTLHRPVLLLSNRLHAYALGSLLDETGANVVVVSDNTADLAENALRPLLQQGKEIRVVTSPGLVASLDEIKVTDPKHALYTRPDDFDDMALNALIMHSSGTTGSPKTVSHCHRWTLACGSVEDESSSITSGTLAVTGTTFHPRCLPMPSTTPVDASARLQWLQACQADHLAAMPSVLEALCQLPDGQGLRALARLRFVAYSGCTMKGALGDRIAAAGVALSPIYGCSEAGVLSSFRYYHDNHCCDPHSRRALPRQQQQQQQPHDWRFFALRQDLSVRARKYPCNDDGGDQTQCCRRRQFVVDVPGWSAPFEVQDDVLASALHRHPELYSVRGRLDDVIVLSHGQNVRPQVVEAALTDSPLVRAAVAFGSERPELGALVVPARPVLAAQMSAFVDALFGLLQGISSSTREDIHYREALVVLPHDAELSVTEKGSVKRALMLQKYEKQIEDAYQKIARIT